jgi:hypothetical protein
MIRTIRTWLRAVRAWLDRRVPAQYTRTQYRRRPYLEALEDRLTPATITVTDVGDTIAVDGKVTLREAMISANANANVNADVVAVGAYGADVIQFNIPGVGAHTIALIEWLPLITDPLTIDGYTQPGAAANNLAVGSNAVLKIILSGNGQAIGAGLTIATSNTTIKGLVVNNFSQDAIRVQANPAWIDNKIQGNFIGTNDTGTAAVANGQDGVYLFNGVTGTLIGGWNPADRNVISGNGHNGVHMYGVNTSQNVVTGNLIGSDKTGTQPVPNQKNGVRIQFGSNNTIGGILTADRNLISGNTDSGILVEGEAAVGNKIFGNFIGTTVTGNAPLQNGWNGVSSDNARFTLVGGDQQGQGNVISGNGGSGVSMWGSTATGTRVEGNKIGLNTNGTSEVGNHNYGVHIGTGSNRNFIGAVSQHSRNIISGNRVSGIRINSDRNEVKNNYIGTNAEGNAPVSNLGHGVEINGGSDNLIGGTGQPLGDGGPSAGNVISGNGVRDVLNPDMGFWSLIRQPPTTASGVILLGLIRTTPTPITTWATTSAASASSSWERVTKSAASPATKATSSRITPNTALATRARPSSRANTIESRTTRTARFGQTAALSSAKTMSSPLTVAPVSSSCPARGTLSR